MALSSPASLVQWLYLLASVSIRDLGKRSHCSHGDKAIPPHLHSPAAQIICQHVDAHGLEDAVFCFLKNKKFESESENRQAIKPDIDPGEL